MVLTKNLLILVQYETTVNPVGHVFYAKSRPASIMGDAYGYSETPPPYGHAARAYGYTSQVPPHAEQPYAYHTW